MHHYIYDADGQRVLKARGGIESVYQNGTIVQETAWLQDYKIYPSAYVVRDANGTTTKHYYNGSERIASRVVGGRDNKEFPISDEYNIEEIRQGIQNLLKLDISKHNPKLEVKYIPKEKQEATEKIVTKAAYYGLYYFHPDHLGTATYLSDENGNPYQFFLNLPFGETMAEQRTGAFQNQYKFNGKELDEETGFYYYGARCYNPQISSWLSVDPHADRYPSFSPYNYVFNNPVNGIDPDGRDGILLVWKNYPAGGIPLTGHAGVLLIDNKTGTTKYYEYGRYDKDNYGIVRHYAVPDVVLGDDGRPTAESLNKVVSFIGDKSGTKKGTEYIAQGAYFKSDKFKEMNEYAQSRLAENSDANREAYSTWSNNCGDFACQTLKQDESIKKKSPLIEAPDPYSLIGKYQSKSDYNLNYKPGTGTTINYNEQTVKYNEQTKQTTSSQSWWQKLWNGKQD